MLFNLFFICSFLSIFSSILVIISSNPVHSVFFLILSFVLVCATILLLELEFIPLILVVVYVGAISVLFLFVVMMLDIKYVAKKQNFFSLIFIGLFFSFLFFTGVILSLKDTLFYSCVDSSSNLYWFGFVDKLMNLNSLSQYLYLDFIVHFLVVGLILLIAIIGAIVLTVEFNNPQKIRGQHLFKQISRTNLETFYFTK
jgi:NADH-quinone oxidoreductase subunit J